MKDKKKEIGSATGMKNKIIYFKKSKNPGSRNLLQNVGIGLCGLTFFCNPLVKADFFVHFWENHREEEGKWTLTGDLSLYNTQKNWDFQGNSFTPTGLDSISRIGFDIGVITGLTPKLSLFGRVQWVRMGLNQVGQQSSSFGFGDQTVGVNYRLASARLVTLDLQAQVDLATYNNSTARTKNLPYLGDGSTDFTFGGFGTYQVSETLTHVFNGTAGVGFTKRNDGFSSSLPWTLSLEVSPKRMGWLGAAGLFGLISLKTDTSSPSTSLNSGTQSPGTGGSFISNAVNPALFGFRLNAGYQFSNQWSARASFAQPLFGQSAPNGSRVAATIEYRFGESSRQDRILERTPPRAEFDKNFAQYSLDARVLKTSDRLNLLKIGRGSADNVEIGQIFDIFESRGDQPVGSPIARAKVSGVRADESALTILEYFREVWIEEGYIARRLVSQRAAP